MCLDQARPPGLCFSLRVCACSVVFELYFSPLSVKNPGQCGSCREADAVLAHNPVSCMSMPALA